MKRIGLTLLVVIAAAAAVAVASAAAGDERSYQVELDNAFGLVQGSEVRIAGVKAGTVTDLDINADKKALISFKIDTKFGELKADATCSSEPQSLIAEYFIDCQPGQSDQPLEGPVPVEQTSGTVPNDLVQNIFREPYKRGLQLLINEFGTALSGNSENLNAAILRGAPALRELKQVLDILGHQNTVIRDLNVNSDAIISQLNSRREDVVTFINEANDAAETAAERRADLGETFKQLPGFLAELQPTMRQLSRAADESTPLLVELNKAAPRLNKFAGALPAFDNAAAVALSGLGKAAETGTRALTKGGDEIKQLGQSTVNAPRAADLLSQFFDSINDPKNVVEEDGRARDDLSAQPGEADRRVELLNQKVGGGVTQPGYTGLEGLLNFGYYQAGALNQFDQYGHILHLQFASAAVGPCDRYNASPTYPAAGGGFTTDPQAAHPCVSVLGDNQPGIGVTSGPTANLPRYDNSVCPNGSTDLDLCDPTISTHGGTTRSSRAQVSEANPIATLPQKAQDLITPQVLQDLASGEPAPPDLVQALGPNAQQIIDQLLQALTGATASSGTPTTPAPSTQSSGSAPTESNPSASANLLDFLFGQ